MSVQTGELRVELRIEMRIELRIELSVEWMLVVLEWNELMVKRMI